MLYHYDVTYTTCSLYGAETEIEHRYIPIPPAGFVNTIRKYAFSAHDNNNNDNVINNPLIELDMVSLAK